MITSIEKRTLRLKLEKYEGKISHMYLDSNGFVTIGTGHLLSSLTDAQKLTFEFANKKTASKAEIRTDYEAVKKLPANRLASSYKSHTKLTLSDVEIDQLTNKHIESFEKELKRIYIGFPRFPSNVRLALFDIIFNIGMTSLRNKWPLFNGAIRANDWQKAADNSKRRSPVSAARNKYVKDLLEKAANNMTPAAVAGKP